jgi:hypothetical protein
LTSTRPPAVDGLFYPADPDELAATVRHLIASAADVWSTSDGGTVHGLVVPHAGFRYSGPVAATGYRLLARREAPVSRVVLLGPAHRAPVRGIAMPARDAWQTPLGLVAVDGEAREQLAATARAHGVDVRVEDAPHAHEHALEVQLPFLQVVLPGVPVLPVLVSTNDAAATADAVDPLWDGTTLLLVSTDLSHYLPDPQARRRDATTVAAVLAGDVAAIGDGDACGARPLRVLTLLAARRQCRLQVLDLRTSADTAGDAQRVVGYAAIAVGPPPSAGRRPAP